MAHEICQRCGASLPASAAQMRTLCRNCGAPHHPAPGSVIAQASPPRSALPILIAVVAFMGVASGAGVLFFVRSVPSVQGTSIEAPPVASPKPVEPEPPVGIEPAVRPPSDPVVGISPPPADDGERAAINRTLSLRVNTARHCYERELQRVPSLAGTVTLDFVVQANGAATDVRVSQNTSNDEGLGACLTAMIMRTRFPPEVARNPITISYPFVFAPST